MSADRSQVKRLYELLVHLMDGGLTDEQQDQLQGLLAQEPDLRQYYVEFLSLSVNLRQYIAGCNEVDPDLEDSIFAEQLSETEEEKRRRIQEYAQQQLETFLAEQEQTRRSQTRQACDSRFQIDVHQAVIRLERFCLGCQRWMVRGAVAAAIVMVLLLSLVHWWSRRPVATLVATSEAQWSAPLQEGAILRPGSFALEQGYARIRLKQGAQMLVQAPTRFDLVTRNKVFLENGWLTAKVPPEAAGFTVASPDSTVVDFGTEFGLLVGSDQEAEVHVFDGMVGLESLHGVGESQTLNEGQAATLDYTGRIKTTPVDQRVKLFVRQIPEKPGFGIPGKRLSLADIVGGGSGLDTGKIGQSLDPGNGRISSGPAYRKNGRSQGFIPMPTLPFIDGLFVPDGNDNPPVISSTGITFLQCPPTSGLYSDYIINGALFDIRAKMHAGRLRGQTFVSQESPSIGMHANAGITFDLKQIRTTMPEARIERFTALCGLSESIVDYPEYLEDAQGTKVSFWVLVDGQVRFHQELEVTASSYLSIDIPLTRNDRFLTLATTDNQKTYNRWSMFALPALELTPQGSK